MDFRRVYHTARMYMIISPSKRADYLKKHHILRNVGEHCMVMFRKIPLYPELISFGNNVRIASGVTFVTHDAIHNMLNYYYKDKKSPEFIGCIKMEDNVFVGANSTILPNVTIGPNVIIGACSCVNKSIANGVYAGTPAKYICSIEQFLDKRSLYAEKVCIKKKHGELTKETIDFIWENFEK